MLFVFALSVCAPVLTHHLDRVWQGQRFHSYPPAHIPSVESVVDALESVDRQGYEETILQRMSENPLPSAHSTRTSSMQLGKASGAPALSKASGAAQEGGPVSGTPPPGPSGLTGDQLSNGEFVQRDEESVSPFTTTDNASPTPALLPDGIRKATGRLCQTRTDLAHLVLCATTAILFALLFALYDNGAQVHQSTRMWFFSVVVAPLGCYIRWQLGRFNFQVRTVVVVVVVSCSLKCP